MSNSPRVRRLTPVVHREYRVKNIALSGASRASLPLIAEKKSSGVFFWDAVDKDTPVIRKNLDDVVAFFFSRAKTRLGWKP